MSYSETLTYNSAASLNFNVNQVQVLAGQLQLLASGGNYPLTNPLVTSQHQNTISALTSFAENSTLPSGCTVTYQLVMGGIPYWYNATNASWALADGTFATSNLASVINTNVSTVFSQLALLTNQFLGLNIFLNTTIAANTPILTSNTIGYTWNNSNPTGINQCQITASLSNLLGGLPVPTAAMPASLLISAPYGFFHGTHFIEPFTSTFNFSTVNGTLTASVIETTTPGVPLKFSLSYWDGQSVKTTFLFNAIVPNQAQVNLSNLSTPVQYDFG
jgi:hypothetical protein